MRPSYRLSSNQFLGSSIGHFCLAKPLNYAKLIAASQG
jgi:hypothetical protein